MDILKKRLPLPSSVMTMSHQLWMSGRTHGPHRWENRGLGRSGPGHLSSLPRGRWVWWGYCPGCSPSSLSALIRRIDSDVGWSLRARLADELAKDQLPALLLAFLSPCCNLAVKCVCVCVSVCVCVRERPWCDRLCVVVDMIQLTLTRLFSSPYCPQCPLLWNRKSHLSLENVAPCLYWSFNLYLSSNSINNIARDFITHRSHRSLSLIDDPVPEYWSLSTNEIVQRQRFQSIRER